MANKNTPIHGIISYTGNTWSVVYKPYTSETGSNVTSSLTGYGDFPFKKYPNLPIVNYKGNDNVFEMIKLPTEAMPEFGGNLADFLNTAKSNGIEVINY